MPSEREYGREKTFGNRIYKYIKNVDTVAKSYGHPVCHNFSNGYDYEVDQPATARLEVFAGVVRHPDRPTDTTYSIAAGDYGWIQIYGDAEIYTKGDVSAIAAGDSLKCVDSADYMEKDQGAGTEPTYKRKVFAMEANTAANALTDVFIQTK